MILVTLKNEQILLEGRMIRSAHLHQHFNLEAFWQTDFTVCSFPQGLNSSSKAKGAKLH